MKRILSLSFVISLVISRFPLHTDQSMFAWTMLGLLACLLSTSSSRTVGLPDKPDDVSLDRTIVLESNIDGKKIEFHHQTNNIPKSSESIKDRNWNGEKILAHSIGYIDDETIFYDSDSSMVMKFKDFEDQNRFEISNKKSGPAANMITESKKGRTFDFMEDNQSPPSVTRGHRMIDSSVYGRASGASNSYDNVAVLVDNKDGSSQKTQNPTAVLSDQKYIYPIQSETLVNYLPKGVTLTHLEKMKQLTSPTVIKNENSIHILMHVPLPKGYATAYKNPIDGGEPTSILNVIKIERVPKY